MPSWHRLSSLCAAKLKGTGWKARATTTDGFPDAPSLLVPTPSFQGDNPNFVCQEKGRVVREGAAAETSRRPRIDTSNSGTMGWAVKRLIGWGLAIAGGGVAVWGGACVVTGDSRARLDITPDLSLSAMTAGLAGLAVLTIGLIWVRD